MLAKAVATESGANFISISMASIGSKWFGEGEKYSRAVFTLASKKSPWVIFIDEVDCILGRRENHGEHEAMRKIKNELMMMWDGLKTKQNERVLVLAATNRPFDLDEAVLRRLPRRLLVDLPDTENRLKILKVILKNEELSSSVDLNEIARMTEGYSGSDLNSLCIAAAYQPIREFLKKEKKQQDDEKIQLPASNNNSPVSGNGTGNGTENISGTGNGLGTSSTEINPEERETPPLREMIMSDFVNAMKEISASVSENAHAIAELRKWNELYGEGGSRKKAILNYYT
jgi:SpoVK/Ycf46/Vps4 family AAA+-type ATPase